MRKIGLGFIGILIGAAAIHAQPLADHVPGDSVVYLGWTGFDSPPAGYEGSHLQALLSHSHIGEVFSSFVPKLARRAAMVNPQVGRQIDLGLSIVSPLLRHPSAVYFDQLQISNRDLAVGAGIVCQAGADAPMLEQRLTALKEQTGDVDWLSWNRDGEVISIQLGTLTPAAGDTLGKTPEMKEALAHLTPDAPLIAHVNVTRVLALADSAVAAINDSELSNYWPKVRTALGVDGVHSLTGCSHFAGKDWMDEVFVAAPAPRHGLLTIRDVSGVLSPDALAPVPATANFVMAATLDLGKGLSILHDSVTAVDPTFGHLFDQGLGALTIFIGRNFQHDVVEAFGPQWVLFTDPATSGNGIAGLTLINTPSDVHKADNALMAMAIAISNTSGMVLQRYGFSVPLERSKFDDVMVNYLGLPLIAPSWAIAGDRLVAAGYPQVVASAAKLAAAGKASIKDDANFKAAVARLKVDQPSVLQYADPRIGAAESYQSLMVVSRLLFGVADAWGVKAPEPVLPSYENLVAELGPMSGAGWVDDAGFHYKSISSFPGAELLNSGNAAVLLSAVASFSGSMTPYIAEQQKHSIHMAEPAPPAPLAPLPPEPAPPAPAPQIP